MNGAAIEKIERLGVNCKERRPVDIVASEKEADANGSIKISISPQRGNIPAHPATEGNKPLLTASEY